MNRFVFALITLLCGVASAATETQVLTHPTKIKLVYDSDRDTAAGVNVPVLVDGAVANGNVAGGTGTGRVTVNGGFETTSGLGATYVETFAEGAAGKGLLTIQLDGTVADLSTGIFNMAYFGGGHKLVYAALGAGQTINLAMAATGLDISGDATDDEGYELMGGILGASGRPFVIGTDPAFKFCVTVEFADISDTDEWHMGFRKLETIQAGFNDYADYFTIGTIGEANPATIFVEHEIGGASATSTDTTQTVADATEVKWCVYVSAAGVATATHNDAAPTATSAYTFADGLLVIPFVHSLHGTSSSMGCVIKEWEVAWQTAESGQ